MPLRVKVGGREEVLVLQVHPSDTMQDVAQQVRKSQEWPAQQHVRFISSGQELFLDDSVAKALGSVLHCIASQGPAVKLATTGKTCHGQKGVQQSPASDWLEMVDPGTVLMWIFGSILALLWLLFVCVAHMFDRTSVIMLCMMTIAFLIPCVLSYIPALRMLQGSSGFSSLTPGRSTHHQQHRAAYSPSAAAAGGPWAAYSTGSTYTGVIPPRPAARVRPGTAL